jgi:hypothetical protein
MSEYENTSPEKCSEVGLSCTQCTESNARELAQACRGLRPKMVAQLFVQIYPAPACARMCGHFVRAYVQAADAPPRKGAASERPERTMAAVA